MDKKKPKKMRGVTAKKTTGKAKSKKTPAKKKQVARGKSKTEKKITAKKTAQKEIRKVKVKAKKGETAGESMKKKKVAKKAVKKVTAKPQKKVTAKRAVLSKKVSLEKRGKVFLPEKEEIYPPLPIEILSEEYSEDSVALMIVDPRKLFIYWEVTEDTVKKYEGTLNIRLYDITGVDFGGVLKNYIDIVIHDKIGNLYLDVSPEKEFIADFGVIDSAGAFFIVARSNRASTPRAEVIGKGMLPQRLYETGIETGLLIPTVGYEK